MTLFLDVYRWFAIAINVCSIVTCRPIGSGASIIYCIYVISVAIAYVTLIKNYLLTYLHTLACIFLELSADESWLPFSRRKWP